MLRFDDLFPNGYPFPTTNHGGSTMSYIFTPTFEFPTSFVSSRTALDDGVQPRSIPPVSMRRSTMSVEEMADEKHAGPIPPRPVMGYNDVAMFDEDWAAIWLSRDASWTPEHIPATCICELDDNCLLLYRSVEYGFELSDAVMKWLPRAVAVTERECRATQHYTNVAATEWLAADVTTDDDDRAASALEFWQGQEDDEAGYLQRTESDAPIIEDMTANAVLPSKRHDEDYTTLIRAREWTKRLELRDAMLSYGLSPAEQAPWVKERIVLKRQDAIREKKLAEKKSNWTEGFPLPSESQIRLRAYASCLASLKKRHGSIAAQADAYWQKYYASPTGQAALAAAGAQPNIGA